MGIEQDQMRIGAARVRPCLGAGEAAARKDGADGVERVALAPQHVRLDHVLGAALRFLGEALLERGDRLAHVEERRDIRLGEEQHGRKNPLPRNS